MTFVSSGFRKSSITLRSSPFWNFSLICAWVTKAIYRFVSFCYLLFSHFQYRFLLAGYARGVCVQYFDPNQFAKSRSHHKRIPLSNFQRKRKRIDTGAGSLRRFLSRLPSELPCLGRSCCGYNFGDSQWRGQVEMRYKNIKKCFCAMVKISRSTCQISFI